MAKFAYVAVRPDGRRAEGVQKAKSRAAAEQALYQRRLRNIRLTEKKGLLQAEITAPRVKREEIMHISRQLAAFVRAGLPVIEAVHTLAVEAKSPVVARMLTDVEDGLRRGETMSECIERHPKIFPEFYRGILRSAELTGRLDQVLTQLASYLERDLEARRKIKSAMIYPVMITGMSLFTVVVLATFVLPRFEVFFDSLGADLPLPTRILLFITDFFANWWWAVLVVVGGASFFIFSAVHTPAGRYLRDRIYLSLPVVGETVRYALVERFCRILASMAGAGVNLPEAMRVATGSLGNTVFTRTLSKVSESMMEGEGLATPLAGTGLFPPTAARMVRVGEDTGTLDTQLEFTARYYEGELDYKLKKLTALFEPLIIVIMGLIVGFVAIALVSAMYGIFGQVDVG